MFYKRLFNDPQSVLIQNKGTVSYRVSENTGNVPEKERNQFYKTELNVEIRKHLIKDECI